MPKYIGGKYVFYHDGILSVLSARTYFRREPRWNHSPVAIARGALPSVAPHSTVSRRLESPVLIRGNFYKLVHYEALQIVAAVWRTALHPQLTGRVPALLFTSLFTLPRGATAIDSYRGIEIWLRISVKCRRGYAVGAWEKPLFNLPRRCATLTDPLRLLNNMRNARKRESSLASEIMRMKVALFVREVILLRWMKGRATARLTVAN